MSRHNPAVDGPLEQVQGDVLLYVLAFPKSSRNEIAGVRNGRLMVRVTAAPEDGKANEAIAKLLAKVLDIPVSHIEVKSGATSREKTMLLIDAGANQVQTALNI